MTVSYSQLLHHLHEAHHSHATHKKKLKILLFLLLIPYCQYTNILTVNYLQIYTDNQDMQDKNCVLHLYLRESSHL